MQCVAFRQQLNGDATANLFVVQQRRRIVLQEDVILVEAVISKSVRVFVQRRPAVVSECSELETDDDPDGHVEPRSRHRQADATAADRRQFEERSADLHRRTALSADRRRDRSRP